MNTGEELLADVRDYRAAGASDAVLAFIFGRAGVMYAFGAITSDEFDAVRAELGEIAERILAEYADTTQKVP